MITRWNFPTLDHELLNKVAVDLVNSSIPDDNEWSTINLPYCNNYTDITRFKGYLNAFTCRYYKYDTWDTVEYTSP